ncbi:MAG: SRPBCC domain-containing protein [Bacteroidia bacterium]|nr:SRPBCC domain-containing protein [Bacteroidia bacterium]MCZ2278122.1 SRPBCC domain-containing protein [Bacteroidia bacterium]
MKDSIVINYVLYASPSEVFNALTQADQIAKWSKAGGFIETEPGGNFEYFDGWVKGKVLEVKPPSLLIITWKPSEWDKKTSASQVKIKISRHDAGSQLTIVHSAFPNESDAQRHESGWIDNVMEPLNEYFTT